MTEFDRVICGKQRKEECPESGTEEADIRDLRVGPSTVTVD